MRTSLPAVAIPAPTMEAIKAWDEEVGSPKYQVRRSQRMAERRAETIVICVTATGETRPAPTAFATAVPERAPARLRTAAMMIAVRGESTRVETDVAMALAASWKPLTNSNAMARRTTRTRRTNESGMFEDDPFKDVGHVLAAVGGVFDRFVDLLPLQDGDGVLLDVEEAGDGLLVNPVDLVLEAVDLDARLVRELLFLEERDAGDDLRRCP